MLGSNGQAKKVKRAVFTLKRKTFDRCVKREKRKLWRLNQNEIESLVDTASKDFWKKIGQVGIGEEMKRTYQWKL